MPVHRLAAVKVSSGPDAGFYYTTESCPDGEPCTQFSSPLEFPQYRVRSEDFQATSVFQDKNDARYAFLGSFKNSDGANIDSLRASLHAAATGIGTAVGSVPDDWCPPFLDPCLPEGICKKCPGGSATPAPFPTATIPETSTPTGSASTSPTASPTTSTSTSTASSSNSFSWEWFYVVLAILGLLMALSCGWVIFRK